MSILIWNIRGVGGVSSMRRLNKLCRVHNIVTLVLLEPFIDHSHSVSVANKLGFSTTLVSNNNKIWVFMRSGYSCAELVQSDQFLHLLVHPPSGSASFLFTCVYAKSTRSERAALWADLLHLQSSVSLPWIVGGDFNAIASVDESIGPVPPDLRSISDFSGFLSQIDLRELPTVGGVFTWTGARRHGRVWRKLDRVLFNSLWLDTFTNCSVQLLNRTTSDHSPLLLSHLAQSSCPRSFRFQSMWLRRPDFQSVMRACWEQPISGYGMVKFSAKLRRLKGTLKAWNRTSFGNVFSNVLHAENRVKELEAVFDRTQLAADLVALNKGQADLLRSLAEEEDFWKQKARIKWLTEGERNTQFFHASVVDKRARLTISKLKNDAGEWVEDTDQLKHMAATFFQQLLTAEDPPDEEVVQEFLDYIPSLVSDLDNLALLAPVTLQEVKAAVFGLDSDSAPGPDGFAGCFYTSCWDVIADDLFLAVLDFFSGAPIPRSIGSTSMVLLPKKSSPVTFGDFRPISLCNFVNKVFTRLLCNRMQPLLPRIISPEQSAFIQGRDISDNILMAQEMVRHLDKRVRGHNVLFKIDMMKAFDRVSWLFLRQLLLKFGFQLRFVNLILSNLSASWFSVLLNGSPAGFFKSTRGLKQGDPLSPYLFILVGEALSRGLSALSQNSGFTPFSLPRGAPCITHLCFADDLVVFSRGYRRTIRTLLSFLDRYEVASGQKINRDKSMFVASRFCTPRTLRSLALLSGISKGTLPFVYLGNTLFKGRTKKHYFQHIVDKVSQRLSGWRGRLLSSGGRLLLIKHVLSAIPTHVFSVLQPPKGVLRQLESSFSKFFWGTSDNTTRRVWRKWTGLCYPVSENGLGVRKLADVVDSFSCKLWWKWRLGLGVWAHYVRSVSWRKSSLCSRLEMVDGFMRANTQVFVHDGSSSFLFDNWSGDGALVDLYALSGVDDLRSLCLRDLYTHCSWDQSALAEVLPLSAISFVLQHHFHFSPTPDDIFWKHTSSGVFTVSTAFEQMRQRRVVRPVLKNLWSHAVPLKVSIFFWRLLNAFLPFPDILQHLGFSMPSRCYLCGEAEDSIDHCFVACSVTRGVWEFFSSMLPLHPSYSLGLYEFLTCHWFQGLPSCGLFYLIPQVICWEVWKGRMHGFFNGVNLVPTSALIARVCFLLRVVTQSKPLRLNPSSFASLGDCVVVRPPRRVVKLVSWTPPIVGWKLNTDGSSLGNPGPSGGGFVLRDTFGHVCHAQGDFYGVQTSFYSELMALLSAVRFCVQGGYFPVIVECDSLMLVTLLRHNGPFPWRHRLLFHDLASLLASSHLSLTHILREGNSLADYLARHASSTQSSSTYTAASLPSVALGIASLDLSSVPNLRVRYC